MINSKYITVISIILVLLCLVFIFTALFFPSLFTVTGDNFIGETIYSEDNVIEFFDDDYYLNGNLNNAEKIYFSDNGISSSGKMCVIEGNTVKILKGGNFILSGAITDGKIIVNSSDNNTVNLIFNSLNVKSLDGTPLYIENSEKTVISLVKGTVNSLTDSENYTDESINKAVISSKDDLVINGDGELLISGLSKDGIKANDSLKIMGGNINVSAVEDGINANDYFYINNSNLNLETGKASIKTSTDDELGFMVFDGGNITVTSSADGVNSSGNIYYNNGSMLINCKDDGIHSDNYITLNNGKIDVASCVEGIEGKNITINDGEYRFIASDDGVNALGESRGGMRFGMGKNNSETLLTINNGKIYIEAGGDGLDSNAHAVINGGYIEVHGPENSGNSSLDFDGKFEINGGTVLAAGSSGMAESPTDESLANSIVVYFDKNYDKGSKITVIDSDNNEVISFTANKKFSWSLISTPDIEIDKAYKIKVNDEILEEVTIAGNVQVVGNASHNMMGGGIR